MRGVNLSEIMDIENIPMEELEDTTKPLAEPIDSCGPAFTNLGLEVLSSFRTSVEVARPPVATFTEAAGLDVDKAVGIVPVDPGPRRARKW